MDSIDFSAARDARMRKQVGFLLLAITLIGLGPAFAADSAEYRPPDGQTASMEGHFAWCGEARTAAERLKRYERFWAEHLPSEPDGYDDSPHIRTVRRCAYRLAQLYAELGRPKDCLKMLKWLEKEDDTLNVGAE